MKAAAYFIISNAKNAILVSLIATVTFVGMGIPLGFTFYASLLSESLRLFSILLPSLGLAFAIFLFNYLRRYQIAFFYNSGLALSQLYILLGLSLCILSALSLLIGQHI